jgi:hypothetical protein
MSSNLSKNFEFESFDIDSFDFLKKRLNFSYDDKNHVFKITKKQSHKNIFLIKRKIFLIFQKIKTKCKIVKNFSSKNFNIANGIFFKKGKE